MIVQPTRRKRAEAFCSQGLLSCDSLVGCNEKESRRPCRQNSRQKSRHIMYKNKQPHSKNRHLQKEGVPVLRVQGPEVPAKVQQQPQQHQQHLPDYNLPGVTPTCKLRPVSSSYCTGCALQSLQRAHGHCLPEYTCAIQSKAGHIGARPTPNITTVSVADCSSTKI